MLTIKYIVYFHQITQVTFGSTPHFWTTMSYRSPPHPPFAPDTLSAPDLIRMTVWVGSECGCCFEGEEGWRWRKGGGLYGIEFEVYLRSALLTAAVASRSSASTFLDFFLHSKLLPPLVLWVMTRACVPPQTFNQISLTSLVFYQVFDWFHRVKTISEYRLALKFFVLVYPISKMALLRKHTDKLAKFSMYVHII